MLTAELPKPTPHVSPFKADPEFARQQAYKAHKTAADLKADGERFRALALEQAKQPTPKPVEQTEALLEAKRQIDLTNEQIAHVRERLNDDDFGFCEHCQRSGMDDKARAALLRELRGLMEHLCRLHNIAQAPTSKAMPARSRSTQAPPIPQPVVVQTPEKPVSQ